jgi:predicted MFS family arabinose efflux permease
LTPTLAKPAFVALAFLLALFQFPMGTTLTSLSTGAVPPPYKGTLVGIEHSLFALAGLAGPTCGQALHAAAGVSGLAAAGAGAFACLRLFWATQTGRQASRAVEK